MKSIQRAHIVVVADSDHGLVLAARLRRMEVARVTPVTGLDAARVICQAGDSDACIVVFDDTVPDAMPIAENDAPGRNTGVPSLMVVPTVTPLSAQNGQPPRLYGGGFGHDPPTHALSPHRVRAATAMRRAPHAAAHAQRHRRAAPGAAAV